jgi:predicted MFS family arabinose efflux permease
MISSSTPLYRDRNFLLFWSGQALSVLGDGFAAVALPLLVLRATGSLVQMGAITATMAVGRILGSLVAGVLADRWDRRRIMIYCDFIRAVIFSLIPVLVHLSPQKAMPFIFIIVMLASFAGNIFHVSCFSSLPALVGRERIVAVNSILWGTYAFMGLVGPLLGGIAIDRFGPSVGIGVDAGSFMFSAISIQRVQFTTGDSLANVSHRAEFRVESFWAGASFIWRTPILRAMGLGLTVVAFLTEARTDLVIYQLEHEAGANADRIGAVLGLGSLGAVIGGIGASRIYRTAGVPTTWLAMSTLASIGFLAMGLLGQTRGVWIVAGLLSLIAFGETVRGVVSQSVRHQVTPDTLLGRVTAAYWALVDLPAALGAFVMTAIAMKTSVASVFVIAGAGSLVAAIGAWWSLRNARIHEETAAG